MININDLEVHNFGKDSFRKAHVQVHARLTRVGAAYIYFDVVTCTVGNRKTFEDVLQLFLGVGKAGSLGNGNSHTKAGLVSLHELRIHAFRDNFDALVVQAHAVMDGTVFFQETDARTMRIAFTIVPRRRAYGNATKTDIRIVLDAECRLVRSGGQNDGTAKVKGIAMVRKSDDALERFRKIGATSHKGNKRRKTGDMLEGVMPELRRVVEYLTDKRENLVAKAQIVFVVDAIVSHII